MKRFYSKADTWTSIILWGTLVITWGLCLPLFFSDKPASLWLLFFVLVPTTILLGSIFFYTYYTIDDKYIRWYTGPFRGKILLEEIKEIKRCKSIMEISSAMKPSLSFKPLLIKYRTYDDIPVSPEEEGEFIDKLRKAIPDLTVTL